MPRQPRQLSPCGIYKVLLRGKNNNIFSDSCDRKRFLEILNEKKDKYGFDIPAWDIKDDQAYFIITFNHDTAQSSLKLMECAMKGICATYAKYFNHRHNCSGPVFYDRYKSIAIDSPLELPSNRDS